MRGIVDRPPRYVAVGLIAIYKALGGGWSPDGPPATSEASTGSRVISVYRGAGRIPLP